MEFLSTYVSEHNVGGLPREQSAENVYEAKIQNGRRWPISANNSSNCTCFISD